MTLFFVSIAAKFVSSVLYLYHVKSQSPGMSNAYSVAVVRIGMLELVEVLLASSGS